MAVIATGEAKLTCCQPEAVSPLNVADASSVPLALHRLPMWVPCSWLPCGSDSGDVAGTSEVNFTPSSTEEPSPESIVAGVAEPKIVSGVVTVDVGVTAFDGSDAAPEPTDLDAVTGTCR